MIDFLGIGAQKSATTWLFEWLRRHPDIHFPGGKEIHFWDELTELGVDWWLNIFRNPPHPGCKQGEITPGYALLDEAVIRRIAAIAPDLRLFYSMRNPISRAWSHALMSVNYLGLEFDQVSDDWFIEEHFTSEESLLRGDYIACLDRWSTVFGSQQLYITTYDEIITEPGRVLGEIACHLGVDRELFRSFSFEQLSQRIFPSPRHPIRPALLDFLRILYQPQISALAERTGRDFRGWISWTG